MARDEDDAGRAAAAAVASVDDAARVGRAALVVACERCECC